MGTALDYLIKYWGYKTFRDPQEDIIGAILDQKDTFVTLPTGGGKSLCYQLPALMMDGICLVISPLIALMEDQIQSLGKKGIKALALNSKLNRNESIVAFDNLLYGNYKFLYISPEKLESDFIQEKLSQQTISLIAIDEAHCISQWGHDFRPSYLRIPELTKLFPKAIKIALTATATPKVESDILENLELKDPRIFKRSFYRSNLGIHILRHENIYANIHAILKDCNEASIIYVGTRKDTVYYAEHLNRKGIQSTYYHGGLTHEQKSAALKDWLTEKKKVMVATNAFGMGIDKSNVRIIIHAHVPFSLENYMQEIGRAGRDGKKAHAYLLFNDNSIHEREQFLLKSVADIDFCKTVYSKLNAYYQIGKGESPEIQFDFNLQEFCITYNLPTLKTYSAINHFHQEGILHFDKNPAKGSRVRIREKGEKLYSIQASGQVQGRILQILLRNYGGIHDQLIRINESFISKKLNLPQQDIFKALQALDNDEVINYKKASNNLKINFLVPREDRFVIHSISTNIKSRNRIKIQNSAAMVALVKNNNYCRNQQLLSYFGERKIKACGQCDVCTKGHIRSISDYHQTADQILRILKNNQSLSVDEIVASTKAKKKAVIKTLQLLLEKKSIGLNLQNKFELLE